MNIRERLAELGSEWHAARQRSPRALPIAAAAIAMAAIVPAVMGLWVLTAFGGQLPDRDAIGRMGEMAQSTEVFDRHDQLAFTIYKEQRLDVPLDQMAPSLVSALLAIEDQRYYDHRGFDALRIMSAAAANLRRGRRAQGGSTITQQLARLSFLTPDKTFRRKIQEVILAGRIEGQYSKEQILELYLNKAYFGDGLYGVEASARGYFGKHASDLTVAESALLAGLVKSPSSYAPTVSLERAVARRNLVLQVMHETGAIDREVWQEARATEPHLKDGLRSDEPHGQYFKEQVRRELVERFGFQRVYEGGLRVYSTIDLSMQEAAETAVDRGLQALDARRKAIAAKRASATPDAAAGEELQAALVAMDPETGQVYAMVGGRSFEGSNFNRAVQARRQPGSAFKPFVYAAALEAGFTPASMIDRLNDPIATIEGDWTPEDEHSTADTMSLRTGLRTSSNRAAVRLLQQVGIPKTVRYAKQMGVGDVPSVPSLALGSGEVTLQSMTAAYASFANGGEVPTPYLVRKVEDRDGTVLYSAQESKTRAITPTTAYLMATMLADVINAGTGARARGLGFTLPAGGKTGTTNDFKDAWFIGFTPKLVAGAWVGFDQPKTILPNGFAGDVVVPVWAAFMKGATKGDKPSWLAAPEGVSTARVCRLSGKLASDGCDEVEVISDSGKTEHRSMVYNEVFARGTAPTEVCNLHQKRSFFGQLAAAFGDHDKPAAPRVEDTGVTPADAAVPVVEAPAVAAAPPPEEPAAPKKKRGFWSKFLGIGKDEKKNESSDDSGRKDKRKEDAKDGKKVGRDERKAEPRAERQDVAPSLDEAAPDSRKDGRAGERRD